MRPRQRNSPLRITHLIFLAIIILLTACTKNQDDIDLPVYEGSIGGDFVLPGTRGGNFELTGLRGKVVLLNFGYSHCPDVCPMVLSRLAKLSKGLQDQGIGSEELQVLFISIDPQRDSVAHLRDYLGFFDKNFIGLSGSVEQSEAVAGQYAVFFEKHEGDNGNYIFSHTDKIFLLDKRGRLRALYDKSIPDKKIVDDVALLSGASL